MTVKFPPVQVYAKHDHFLPHKLNRKRAKIKFYTDEELDTIQKMHNQGATYSVIGKAIGRSENSVAQKIAKIYRDYDVQDFTIKQMKKK